MSYPYRTIFRAGAVLILSAAALAAATITMDENGNGDVNGTPLAFNANAANPNPPNQTPVLQYTLPFAGVAGNLELIEPETHVRGDVLQFLGNGSVIFYSKPDSDSSLAERYFPPIPPAGVPNTVTLTETGSPGNDGVTYTPTAGQPGFDPSGPTYNIISDSPSGTTVPEPASASLMLLAVGASVVIVSTKLRKA